MEQNQDHLAAASNGSPGGAKVSVTLQDLRSWAVVAQSRGTEHAFVDLALEWAAAAMREIDRGAAASEAELSTLRQQLAEAVRERDALRSVVQSALNNNGGPIDADSTLDGKSYVMVLREDFDAIDAASRVAGT